MATGCIYCGKQESFSDEHHLPRCLGSFRDYETLKGRICEEHNNACSKLDEQLCRSGGEAFFRQLLGIGGRKRHDKPSPFYRGSAGGGRLKVEGTAVDDGRKMALEVSVGEVSPLRHLALVVDGKREVIPIPPGMTPDVFKARFDALELKRVDEAYICAPVGDQEYVDSLMKTIFRESETEWKDGVPTTYTDIDIEITVTQRYYQAIAKIGFHYFLLKMGDYFQGDEQCFDDVRDFIMNGGDWKRCERLVPYDFKPVYLRSHPPVTFGHVVGAHYEYHSLFSKVQLFLGPGCEPPVYTVNLGKNPWHVFHQNAKMDFFAYFPEYFTEEQRGGFDGEVQPGTPLPLSAVRRLGP